MHEEKEIKIIPITVGTGEKSKELKFVCMPDILESDHRIKTYLEQQKMQIGFAPKGDENSGKVEDESINSSIKELKVRVFFKEVDRFKDVVKIDISWDSFTKIVKLKVYREII